MTPLRTSSHHAPLPVLRAAVFAVVGTVLGVSAHHLVAEGPVPWRPGASAASVLFAVGLLGARRPRSLTVVAVVCTAAQLGLHLYLTFAHTHHTAAMGSSAYVHHHMDAHGTWHERLHDSLAMTVVHMAAALLVAVLLHRADAVCWSLARGLTAAGDAARARIATAWALLTADAPPREAGLPSLVRVWLEQPPLRSTVLTDVVVRRGPPRAGLTHAI